MARIVKPSKGPNLPIPPNGYSQTYFSVLLNVLRLYFNQIDVIFKEVLGIRGGQYLNFPYITAYDAADQYAAGNDTPTKINWTNGTVNGFRLVNGAAYADQDGLYKIDYSLQLVNTANDIHQAVVWLRVNGADVAESTSFFTLPARKSMSVYTYVVAYSHVTYEMRAGDYVELWWATDQAYNTTGPVDGVYIVQEPAQTSPYAHPGVPSSLGTITFVSSLQA